MKNKFLTAIGTIAASGMMVMQSALGTVSGPISPYYLTSGDYSSNFVIQANTLINAWQQYNGYEYAIAVPSTIRTLSFPGYPGSEYTTAGAFTGTSYANPLSTYGLLDGTTDGQFNYALDFTAGTVYKFNLDWSNPQVLFTIPSGANEYEGITYDGSNNSLWLSRFDNSGIIEDRSLAGSLISSFVASNRTELTALAMDPADHTLWMSTASTNGFFYHYQTNGTYAGTVNIPQIQSIVYGGEFLFVIPEPTSLSLVGLGLLSLFAVAKRRQ